ncbi:MAG TPA: hypothetical protein VIT45_16625 [Allosphingosinicella sp.]
MKMKLALLGTSLLALGTVAAVAQTRSGGTATYWMTAETSSGMAGMAAGMSGRGNAASAAMAMLGNRGSRSSYVRNLHLQLGTGQRPAGAPTAEHLPPAGLQAGPSLPLVSPQGAAPAGPTGNYQMPTERPRGRMLIYWGCGEHARAGQPVIVDFATMTSGRMPPAFANSPFRPMTPPGPGTSTTYGEWPNERSGTQVPANGSLIGPHTVRGNYTPNINFTLGAGQDFLAPVVLTQNKAGASGSVPLVWQPVPGSQAWLAMTMGAGQNGDFVLWSSSESQVAMMGMGMDYLPQAEIARLIGSRVLMPAAADRCTVPAEVARAAPQSMLMLTAFGGEANFSHPVRPARAAASWKPEWTVKLRTKSTYSGLLGMSMEEMMGDSGRDDGSQPGEPPKKKKNKLKRGLGTILGQ